MTRIALKAAKSSAWMFAGGAISNGVGVIGTVLVARILAPAEYGEVAAAAVIVGSVQQMSTLGIGQYVVVKVQQDRERAFSALVVHLAVGVAAMAAVWLWRHRLGIWISAPGMGRFMGGFIVAALIDRVAIVPERTLMRSMRFRNVAVSRAAGDLTCNSSAVVLAALGFGGAAVVVANVLRSVVKASIVIGSLAREEWFVPVRPRVETLREIGRFGWPLWIGGMAGFGSRRWDNLLVSRFFGPAVMAAYNLALNLAEAPVLILADQAVDVLLPTFTKIKEGKRAEPLLRALSLLSLMTCPLVLGLGVVSPTVVDAFLGTKWHSIAPMLTVLSAMSVTRPLAWATNSYFQAASRPRVAMGLEVCNVVLALTAVAIFGRHDPLMACLAVGAAAAARALIAALVVRKEEGISLGRFFLPQLGPLLACAPMVLVVLGTRRLLGDASPAMRLPVEGLAGGVAFVAGALLLARPTVRDALGLARDVLPRRFARVARGGA